ncbi:MAG TPA: EAL domain-containing protein, partial [Aquificales bacterium]|nr:EAL domain-containing protein [Aquificales bacterium]
YGVKIDRSLIADIPQKFKQFGDQAREFKFIKNLISFLKSMGYVVTVEGVETPEMVELAKRLQVDEVQGFYYSKPVDEEKFLKCLREWDQRVKSPFSKN